jgi:hypothetical protein
MKVADSIPDNAKQAAVEAEIMDVHTDGRDHRSHGRKSARLSGMAVRTKEPTATG